jgi:hypothetical protein
MRSGFRIVNSSCSEKRKRIFGRRRKQREFSGIARKSAGRGQIWLCGGLAFEISGYAGMEGKAAHFNHWLVAEAVGSNCSPWVKFPANREIYRELKRIKPSEGQICAHWSSKISPLAGEFPRQSNRELNRQKSELVRAISSRTRNCVAGRTRCTRESTSAEPNPIGMK